MLRRLHVAISAATKARPRAAVFLHQPFHQPPRPSGCSEEWCHSLIPTRDIRRVVCMDRPPPPVHLVLKERHLVVPIIRDALPPRAARKALNALGYTGEGRSSCREGLQPPVRGDVKSLYGGRDVTDEWWGLVQWEAEAVVGLGIEV